MTAVAKVDPATGEITRFDPSVSRQRQDGLDSAIELAARIGNWEKLAQAAAAKVAEQAAFVAWWDSNVSIRESNRKAIASMQSLSAELAQKKTGISPPQVSRWRKRLKNAEAYIQQLVEAAKSKAIGNQALAKATADKQAELRRPVQIDPAFTFGDFRIESAAIPDNSVELVFIDPPYDDESTPLYGEAARVAARILKRGGSLITYVGQMQLPAVLPAMSEHLRYWWIGGHFHDGGPLSQLRLKGIVAHAKPLLWFVKETRGDVQTFVDDYVRSKREKDTHPWQQDEAVASYYIQKLCPEGGTAVDFFAGGGTTLVAAKRLGRKYVGYEKDPAHYERASKRLDAING